MLVLGLVRLNYLDLSTLFHVDSTVLWKFFSIRSILVFGADFWSIRKYHMWHVTWLMGLMREILLFLVKIDKGKAQERKGSCCMFPRKEIQIDKRSLANKSSTKMAPTKCLDVWLFWGDEIDIKWHAPRIMGTFTTFGFRFAGVVSLCSHIGWLRIQLSWRCCYVANSPTGCQYTPYLQVDYNPPNYWPFANFLGHPRVYLL